GLRAAETRHEPGRRIGIPRGGQRHKHSGLDGGLRPGNAQGVLVAPRHGDHRRAAVRICVLRIPDDSVKAGDVFRSPTPMKMERKMSKTKELVARLFGKKDAGCCGVEFEREPGDVPLAANADGQAKPARSCCGASKGTDKDAVSR